MKASSSAFLGSTWGRPDAAEYVRQEADSAKLVGQDWAGLSSSVFSGDLGAESAEAGGEIWAKTHVGPLHVRRWWLADLDKVRAVQGERSRP